MLSGLGGNDKNFNMGIKESFKLKEGSKVLLECDFRSNNYWIEIDNAFIASKYVDKSSKLYPVIGIKGKGTSVTLTKAWFIHSNLIKILKKHVLRY